LRRIDSVVLLDIHSCNTPRRPDDLRHDAGARTRRPRHARASGVRRVGRPAHATLRCIPTARNQTALLIRCGQQQGRQRYGAIDAALRFLLHLGDRAGFRRAAPRAAARGTRGRGHQPSPSRARVSFRRAMSAWR
jgi:hypothetical protein